MTSRTLAQVPPTAGEIALNAYIHGYGGHSLVTPHAALKQLWWTDERIESKVTKRFIISKLRGEERAFLNRTVVFGEGLTDHTYLDWILERARRLFLILSEIGCSDQIFGCVDDSWSDDDLPLKLEEVQSLDLSYDNDPALNQRFYKTQFTFLLRPLHQGRHVEYGPQEHIPLEFVFTLPPAVTLQAWDRVHFPGQPDKIFVRRKFTFEDPLRSIEERRRAFRCDTRRAQELRHAHIAPVWATYVSDNAGYVISSFVPEHTLQTFVDHRTPMQLMRLPVERRPIVLCQWMHCLADAVSFMHHSGIVHGSIKPSNIIIDHDNNIAFADIGSLRTFQQNKKIIRNETHDYAAPESQRSSNNISLPPSPTKGGKFRLSRLRNLSISTSGSRSSSSSSSSSDGATTYDSGYGSAPASRPDSMTPSHIVRADSGFSIISRLEADPWALTSATGFLHNIGNHEPTVECAQKTAILPRSTTSIDPGSLQELPVAEPEMSDVYSLGCIFLDIVTFVMRGKLNDFVKLRTSKIMAMDGSKKKLPDSSYHGNADKVDEWMEILDEESLQYGEAIYRGIPDILRLIKRMLCQNATTRPTACQVRDRLNDILALQCGVDDLCCADSVWYTPRVPAVQKTSSVGHAALMR